MRPAAPFQPADLAALGELYERADAVIPMRDAVSDNAPTKIAVRHDVDDNAGSFRTALNMAEWEAAHGYRSTYFLLHHTHYWDDALTMAPRLEELGHEVGLHVNAVAMALRMDGDPVAIFEKSLADLRGSGVTVTGIVAHGDGLCRPVGFVNDEMFAESPRPDWGAPRRTLVHGDVKLTLPSVSRGKYGIDYDASWLPRGAYLSDSGGKWQNGYSTAAYDETAAGFPFDGQLHMLVHPDWWSQAFAEVRAV